MGLRFDPIGGGQFKQAVKQIIEVERQPIKTLEGRKAREEGRMKLFQEFKGKFTGIDRTLEDFTNFKKFRELKADLGDGAHIASVTFDKDNVEPGSYTIQVDQLAQRTSIISNGFSDPEEKVLGIGFIVVRMNNGDTKEIFIDEADSSLNGVASVINRDQRSPIRASVIKDMTDPEHPWRIIIASKSEGFDDHVNFPEFYFLDGLEDFYIDGDSEARNALLYVDGFPVEAEGNDIKNFISGVNLHLKAARPDQSFSLIITEDHQKMSGKVKTLVDQVNGILEFINKQNQVDERSDTKSTFAGDTGLQTVEYRLRNMLHEGFPSGDPETEQFRFMFLGDMGIEFGKNGLLNFKEDKFTKALEGNFDEIAEALTGQYGFANQMKTVIASYTRSGSGMLTTREQGLRAKISKLDDEIAQKEQRLEQKTQAITEKFSRLQASLGNLQRQQQYLSAVMPGGGSSNLVSQLLGGG